MKATNILLKQLIVAVLILIYFTACSTTPYHPLSDEDLQGVHMTTTELSIRINEFEKYFMSRVEEACDEIISQTDDRQIKMNALEWKINIFPRMMESSVILDPRAVGIDIYALSGQMLNFFKTGNGKDLFGKYQYVAIDACEDIMLEVNRIANDYRELKYREQGTEELNKWIEENPIENLKFHRRSTYEALAKVLGVQDYDIGTSVGSLTEAVHDIRKQISVYTTMLPKQAKWEAQLISYEVFGDSTFEKSFNNFDRLVNDVDRISETIDDTPELLKEMQKSSFEELHKELLLTLSTLKEERSIILDEINTERIDVMRDVYQQRIETLERIDKLAEKTINQSSIVASDLVDKIFIRIIVLLILILIGGLVGFKYVKKSKLV